MNQFTQFEKERHQKMEKKKKKFEDNDTVFTLLFINGIF